MKLIEMSVTEFIDTMASDAPAPGGGSASAMAAATGAALTSMVCALTLGKKKYAGVQTLAADGEYKAQRLKERCMGIIDRDTDAFNAVSAVFAMPKDTEEQKAERKAAMQEALKGCTKTPFEMMECALETLELVETLQGKLNSSAASDLGCAVLNLRSAVQGAWLNVLINIGGIDDTEFAEHYRRNGKVILDKAVSLADKLYKEILESI